jgi:chromosomal replication initiator protein
LKCVPLPGANVPAEDDVDGMTAVLHGQEDSIAGAPAGLLVHAWSRICDRMKTEVGEVEYRTWLRQITVGPLDGDEITLLLPTRFLRDWVRGQYGDRLNALWNAELPSIRRVELQVARPGDLPAAQPENASGDEDTGNVQSASVTSAGAAAPTTPAPADLKHDLTAPLDPRFTFESFVVGKPNEFAYACARRVAEKPSSPGFNPLFLYGGVGLGKTHLMHAIGDAVDRGGAQYGCLYVSREIHVPFHRGDPFAVHDGIQGTTAFRRCADDR